MAFDVVYVYDGEGNFLGSTIYKEGSKKLHTANLWQETPEDVEDLNAQLTRVREEEGIRINWPDSEDPDVKALLDDPGWEEVPHDIRVWKDDGSLEYTHVQDPVKVAMRIHKACETVARERARGQLV